MLALCPTAAPYWLHKPSDQVLAPEENGRLVCRANGNPKPRIEWLVNGQPIESMVLFNYCYRTSALFLMHNCNVLTKNAA